MMILESLPDTMIRNLDTITVFRSDRLKEYLCKGPLNIVTGGASRGGTSAVACVLRALGNQMGDNLHSSTHEDLDFVNLVNEGNFDNDTWKSLATKKLDFFYGWSIKLPAAFQMLHIWEEILPNPLYIIVMRNPFSVARSLIKWDEGYDNCELDYFRGYGHAISMYADCLDKIGGVAGAYCVCEYERLVRKPDQFVRDIAEVCGFPLNPSLLKKCTALISENGYKEVA